MRTVKLPSGERIPVLGQGTWHLAEVAARRDEFEAFLTGAQETIRRALMENNLSAQVQGRIKRLYSVHQKAQRQKRTVDQVYDLLAVRVVTDLAHVDEQHRDALVAAALGAGSEGGSNAASRGQWSVVSG